MRRRSGAPSGPGISRSSTRATLAGGAMAAMRASYCARAAAGVRVSVRGRWRPASSSAWICGSTGMVVSPEAWAGAWPSRRRATTYRALIGRLAEAVLRHAAPQRHVAVHPDPAPVRLPRQHDGRPARPREGRAVPVEAGAHPGGDGDRHGAVGRGQHLGVRQVEGEVRGARPDIVPLACRSRPGGCAPAPGRCRR